MVMASGAIMNNSAERRKTANHESFRAAGPARQGAAGFSTVLACVDGSPHATEVLAWAITLAQRLNASLRIFRVLDTSCGHDAPRDPIDWELRRREAQSQLEALLEHAGVSDAGTIRIEVAVGEFQERLQAFLADTAVDICVIGAVGEAERPDRVIGDTARRIVETASCSVLIVPPQASGEAARNAVTLRRLMVPLDCSRRAETALPIAIALADAFGAEIVMAHAVPEPAITDTGPPGEAEVTMRSTVAEHNRKAAVHYMSRLRARMAFDRRPLRTLILSGADPRHQLVNAAISEMAEMIILAAKGAGGYADQSLGSVADFLVTHISKPILIVRPRLDRKASSVDRPTIAADSQNLVRSQA